MIKWIKGLFRQEPPIPKCQHKWKTIEEGNIAKFGKTVGKCYVQQCEHCGELKHYNVYIYD